MLSPPAGAQQAHPADFTRARLTASQRAPLMRHTFDRAVRHLLHDTTCTQYFTGPPWTDAKWGTRDSVCSPVGYLGEVTTASMALFQRFIVRYTFVSPAEEVTQSNWMRYCPVGAFVATALQLFAPKEVVFAGAQR